MIFDGPGKPEERDGNEDRADVSKGQAILRSTFAVVAGGEPIVDGVDPGDDEPDAEEETKTGSKIEQPDLLSVEAVFTLIDWLHIGVDAVGRGEEDGLVGRHREDNGLDEDPKRPGE